MNDHQTSKKLTRQVVDGMRIRHAAVENASDKLAVSRDMAYLSHLDRAELLGEVERLSAAETSTNPFRRRLAMLETTGPTNLPRLEISFQTLSDMQAASDWLRALGRESPRTSEELAQETPDKP